MLLRCDLELLIAANTCINNRAVFGVTNAASGENIATSHFHTISHRTDDRFSGLSHVVFLELGIALPEAAQLVHLVDADFLPNEGQLHGGLMATAHRPDRSLRIGGAYLRQPAGIFLGFPGEENVIDQLIGEIGGQRVPVGLKVSEVVVGIHR